MNELDEVLASLVDNVDGTVVAAIGGTDGLLIEQYPTHQEDLSVVTAEVTNVLNTANAAVASLDAGSVREIILSAERSVVYTRLFDADMFCILVMSPSGNLGKARLYCELASKQIKEVLA